MNKTTKHDAANRKTAMHTFRDGAGGAAISTNSFGYAFDPIGNRLASSINGAETTYTASALNQYTGISTPNSSFPIPNSFDADGNMLSDGVFAYAWDAENRLVSAVPIIPAHGSKRIQNRYDWQHRLVQMDAQIYQGGAWHPHEMRTLVYDGWLPILELTGRADGTSGVTEYFWGTDLSGTEQGAGGVGGLLAVSVDGQYHLPCYDHNGNVTAYIGENGTPSAQYLYDAFGNTLEQSGAMADAFRFRFSTKYFMPETRSYYYGYRFYLPEQGRWLNRDPIEEQGGLNLYGFVKNNPVTRWDRLGLFPLTSDLEIDIDYKRVPIRQGRYGPIYATTEARGPDIVDISNAEIIQEGKCCAKVKSAPRRKMTIHTHWLSESEIGKTVTSDGYDAVVGHEVKRGSALIDGFTAYYGPVSGKGKVALKCGTVCSKSGFEDAKQKLSDYLFSIGMDAWSQFDAYEQRAQRDISRENREWVSIEENGKSLFDWLRQEYGYRSPPPFKERTPCPE